MKSIRLLPVVVLAIAAVLILKTIGLATHGGYVLTGVSTARAAGGHDAPAAGTGDATVTFPSEPTLTDNNPVLSDGAPTVGQSAAPEGHGEVPAPAAGHGEAASPAVDGEAVAASDGMLAATHAIGAACLDIPVADISSGHDAPGETVLAGTPIDPNCRLSDATPMQMDADGNKIPFTDATGASLTDRVLLERLAARRDELQAYEDELSMRAALVDAAEKRIQERTAALETLEAQISALVDQRKAMEDEQFARIVSMYEAMKPKDAAAIFDTLDMDVLLRVAKAVNARKMAPIMAAMSSARAQELTVAMATIVTDPPERMTPNDLAALPQIIGQ